MKDNREFRKGSSAVTSGRRNNKRREAARRRAVRAFAGLALFLGMVFAVLLISNNTVRLRAQEEMPMTKYYRSITIERGDTLWSIAREYMGNEYDEPGDYIDEVKAINGLVTDKITAGDKLIIVYFK